ncbi:MAG: fluoride efflux transporter CrcB [Ignavibacteria bacterium]
MKILLVIIGSGLGGGMRFWISSLLQKIFPVYFPIGTLAVNFLGSLILGIIIFAFDEKLLIDWKLRFLLGVGFCGGLTTFSTFSLETFNLFKDAEFFLAGLNILLNVSITLVGVYIGYLISR